MMDDSQQRHCDICWIEGGHAGVLLSLGIDFAPGYLTAVLDVEELLTHYDSALGPLLSITDSLGFRFLYAIPHSRLVVEEKH
jgi:hypothetical protein